MQKHVLFVAALSCVLTLAACGLKGPLYRPDERTNERAQASPNVPDAIDKLRRPRPAPQTQKEPVPPSSEAPMPEAADPPTANGVQSLPAEETR